MLAAFTQVRPLVLPLRDPRISRERDELLRDAAASKSDFIFCLRAWELARSRRFDTEFCRRWGIHGMAARQAGAIAEQFLGIARGVGLSAGTQAPEPDAIRRCLLAGFSDHLARRMDRATLRCRMVHGRRGEIRRQSVVREAPLLVSGEIEERDVRGEVTVLLGMNTEVEESWLREDFPDDFREEVEEVYEPMTRKVIERRRRYFRDLILEERELSSGASERSAGILADEIIAGRLKLKRWNRDVERWITRVNFVASHFPEVGIAAIGGPERRILLVEICQGASGFRAIKDRAVMPVLRKWLRDMQAAAMEELAPDHYLLPSGQRVKIGYREDGRAVLSATIQQLYDVPGIPSLGDGRVPLTMEILAPNRRPVQITSDLVSFWRNAYPEIRKTLKGRYPKHEWR